MRFDLYRFRYFILGEAVENQEEVLAQAKLIPANPLANKSIGDTPIDWDSSMGDPTAVAEGSFDGVSAFVSDLVGVRLTTATDSVTGSLYWDKEFDYTKNIHISGVITAGNGDGADGITVFLGCDNSLTSSSSPTNGIAIYFDEYNGGGEGTSVVKIYNDGNQVFETYADIPTGDFDLFFYLDDLKWRQFDIIYQYISPTSAELFVLFDGVYVCKVNVGSWVSTAGTYVGISAWCGGDNNEHYCKKFQVKSATPWLLMNA